jgi:hypothetical protein
MTKDQMREGFARGKTLVQEEWANSLEIKWLDELIAEGVATLSAPWDYKDTYQCERRRVTGVAFSRPERGEPNA